MSTLHEVEKAVRTLSSVERAQLLDWMAVALDVGLRVSEPPVAYGAVALERDFYSIEEYFELEEKSALAYEYVAGRIYAMAEPCQSHEIIVSNLLALIHSHLGGRPCRTYSATRRIHFKCRNDDFVYRPDVWVGCGEKRDAKGEFIDEPLLVIEVLSPSTERTDTREKALNCREIRSLEECLLVAQKPARVIAYRRADDWKQICLESLGDTLELESIGLALPVAQIYRGIP